VNESWQHLITGRAIVCPWTWVLAIRRSHARSMKAWRHYLAWNRPPHRMLHIPVDSLFLTKRHWRHLVRMSGMQI